MAEFYPGPSYDSACQHPQDYCGHEIHIPIRKHGRQPVFRLSCSMLVTFTNCVTSPAKTMLPVSHLSTVHCVTPSERLCRIGLFLGGGRERENGGRRGEREKDKWEGRVSLLFITEGLQYTLKILLLRHAPCGARWDVYVHTEKGMFFWLFPFLEWIK